MKNLPVKNIGSHRYAIAGLLIAVPLVFATPSVSKADPLVGGLGGALVGGLLGGTGGMIVGGLAGATVGAVVEDGKRKKRRRKYNKQVNRRRR